MLLACGLIVHGRKGGPSASSTHSVHSCSTVRGLSFPKGTSAVSLARGSADAMFVHATGGAHAICGACIGTCKLRTVRTVAGLFNGHSETLRVVRIGVAHNKVFVQCLCFGAICTMAVTSSVGCIRRTLGIAIRVLVGFADQAYCRGRSQRFRVAGEQRGVVSSSARQGTRVTVGQGPCTSPFTVGICDRVKVWHRGALSHGTNKILRHRTRTGDDLSSPARGRAALACRLVVHV